MGDDIIQPKAVTLTTSDGLALEGELARPSDDPRAVVVLAHPHPLHGGSMRSLVTGELFAALPRRGLTVLRFNFRGVGASEGSHGGGIGEQHDVVAAIDHVAGEDGPLVLAGWSFGADVSLAVSDDRVAAWFLVAPPLRTPSEDAFVGIPSASDPRPKWFLVPERDNFRRPDQVRAITAGWRSTSVDVVPGADHFLVGRTTAAVDALDDAVRRLAGR